MFAMIRRDILELSTVCILLVGFVVVTNDSMTLHNGLRIEDAVSAAELVPMQVLQIDEGYMSCFALVFRK